MNKRLKSIQPLMNSTLRVLIPGMATVGLAIVTQAQSGQLPVKPVAKMIYGQMTNYEESGTFLKQVEALQNRLKSDGLVLPPDNDYAIRTTTIAAYNYVIPKAKTKKAHVGALFVPPDGSSKLLKIICTNEEPGAERPTEPELVVDPKDPKNISMKCGEGSYQDLLIN